MQVDPRGTSRLLLGPGLRELPQAPQQLRALRGPQASDADAEGDFVAGQELAQAAAQGSAAVPPVPDAERPP